MTRATMLLTATAMLTTFAVGTASAQDWPNRPISLIVPFSAGGGIDASARIQALHMGELLGQSIVVENVGAVAGQAGSSRVSKSPPDGYTFLIGNSGTHAFSQALYKKPMYNSATEFQPVGLMTESPRLLVARKDLPVNNLKEFVAYVKANQDKMQFSSAGVGSGTHLPCVLLNMQMGVNVTHVPYRGEGPALQDVIAGRIDYMCTTIQSGAAQAKQNTVKGIAVMAHQRAPIIDLATSGEQGLAGVESSVWNAFFLPPGTPAPIVAKLNKAMGDTIDNPTVRKKLEDLGLEIVPPARRTPAYLTKFIPEEIERWIKVVKAAGIEPQ
jgi:tripartite-type tricarboxylate transporter receptor subunit TctC